MKHCSWLISVGLVLAMGFAARGLAQENLGNDPSVEPPVIRGANGFYSAEPLKKPVEKCDQRLSDEDDALKPTYSEIYRQLAKQWYAHPDVAQQNFVVLLEIAKEGALVDYKPLRGLKDKKNQLAFSTYLHTVFPGFQTEPLPNTYIRPKARFVISSQGIHYFANHTTDTDPFKTSEIEDHTAGVSPKMVPWMTQLDTYLKDAWHPPAESKRHQRRAEIMLTVAEDGGIVKKQILTSSCSEEMDNSILLAVDNLPKSQTLKLPPLPFKPQLGFIRILYVFDSKH